MLKKTKSNFNNKAINAIYNGVNLAEFHRISACPNAKAAWDLLRIVHKGTDIIKQTKLQNLTTAFETIQMKDSETFDEFNSKLSKIVNSSFNLGEPLPQPKIVKKILRFLLDRFRPKVVAIEEYQDLNSLSVEDLVGNLQTYEANHCQIKNGKEIALKSSKFVNSDFELECDSDDVEFEK